MKILTYAVFGLVALTLAVACALWGGFAASVLWGWFVVPLGVPGLSVAQAMGVMVVLRVAAGMPRPEKRERSADKMVVLAKCGDTLSYHALGAAGALATCWVVKGFM